MLFRSLPGILDIHEFDDEEKKGLALYTKFEDFGAVRDSVSKLGYVVREAELIKEAKVLKSLNEDELEKVNRAIEKIEESDDVQNVWSNLE